jgi:GNAT superfamily N-acetyltransferase
MHRVEIHESLSALQRTQVSALIYQVWAAEAAASNDVTILTSPRQFAVDPLDDHAVHVLVHCDQTSHQLYNQLVGYGRLSMAYDAKDMHERFSELGLAGGEFPVAYISRLVVHPDVRGQGIATRIHNTRINIARRLGAKSVYGWAVGEKPRGSLFRCGFREASLRQGFLTRWYETSRPTRLVRLDLLTGARAC